MITEENYRHAVAQQKAAQEIINAYHKQKSESFDRRWKEFEAGNAFFTDDDLVYSAGARCEQCEAGLAYPKNCGPMHQWTCSAVLKGTAVGGNHEALPFAFFEVKSEQQPSAAGATTRPKKEVDANPT